MVLASLYVPIFWIAGTGSLGHVTTEATQSILIDESCLVLVESYKLHVISRLDTLILGLSQKGLRRAVEVALEGSFLYLLLLFPSTNKGHLI